MIQSVGTVLAAIVAVVFGVAATVKLRSPKATIIAMIDMGFIGQNRADSLRVGRVLWMAVVLAELTTSASLLASPRLGAVLGLVILVLFTVVLMQTVRRRPHVRCACFGQSSQRPIGPATFLRNALLFGALIAALGATTPRWELASAFVGLGALLVGLVSVQLVIVVEDTGRLFGQFGDSRDSRIFFGSHGRATRQIADTWGVA